MATITADPDAYPIWPPQQGDVAVYVRHIAVSREHAGRRPRSALLSHDTLASVAPRSVT